MPRINQMYVFAAEEGPDDEGVVAFSGPDGQWYPMVGADDARVMHLMPEAKKIAKLTGRRIRVLKFTTRQEMEVIEP